MLKSKENKMVIRRYKPLDCRALAELFYNTVHIVNAKDYAKEQQAERQGIFLTNFTMEKER